MLNIVIFGAPGSGKGTQSERIVEKLECDAAEIKMDTEFSTLGIDSLDVMELLMNLEEELGTEIEMGENKVNTVGDLVKLIEEKQA